MIETMFEVVDRASGDVIAFASTAAAVESEREKYMDEQQVMADIRQTTRCTDCKEFREFCAAVNDMRKVRAERRERRLSELRHKAAQGWKMAG